MLRRYPRPFKKRVSRFLVPLLAFTGSKPFPQLLQLFLTISFPPFALIKSPQRISPLLPKGPRKSRGTTHTNRGETRLFLSAGYAINRDLWPIKLPPPTSIQLACTGLPLIIPRTHPHAHPRPQNPRSYFHICMACHQLELQDCVCLRVNINYLLTILRDGFRDFRAS